MVERLPTHLFNVATCYKKIKYEGIITEEVGFEPTDACTSLVFKTSAINHSTTLPEGISP